MFGNINEPFYQTGQRFKLGPIDENIYADFIVRHFMKANKKINTEDVLSYIDWCNNRTLNIQMISNRLFALNIKKIVNSDIDNVKLTILSEMDDVYYLLKKILTKLQWKIIQSIAHQGKVYEPYGKKFMSKYGFTNSSSVRRGINKFSDQGILFYGVDKLGDFLEIDDVFLQKWIVNTLKA